MKISVITDEVSSDLETALEIIRAWGIDAVELRGIGADRYPEVPDYWHFRVPELVREAGVQVVAISPGLFQIPPPGRPRALMSFSRRGDTARVRHELARPYIRHVHFKDGHIDPVSGQRAWVVDGIIDWPGAIASLKHDGFDGYISVETHVRPKLESTLRCLERLRRLVQGVEPDRTTADPLQTVRVPVPA